MPSPEDIERISVSLQARNVAFLDAFAARNGYSRSLALRVILRSAETATNNFSPPLAQQVQSAAKP
jgi:hypothetical protein